MKTTTNILILSMFIASCNDNKMEPVSDSTQDAVIQNVFNQNLAPDTVTPEQSHHAVVIEVLKDGRYQMLLVEEEEERKWLITRENQVSVGDHIDYQDGLLKQQYKNTSVNRAFDEVMLVSTLSVIHQGEKHEDQTKSSTVSSVVRVPGVLTPSELLAKASKLEGKKVQVQGVVTKVNANIMKRHWIHISETENGRSDLVITTEALVPVGHTFVFEGTVSVKKDFGAGYFFEVILENAKTL